MLACVVCGERGAADVILNVILFVPLGALLELKGERLVRICLAAALLSGAIELAQLFIPGRDTSPGDVLSNTTGGVVGHLIACYLPRALGLPRRAAVLASAGTAALPALVVAGTGLLLRPALPASTYYGQWTPNLGHLEWYRGRVLSAMLGGLPLPARKLVNSDTVRALLLAGAPLEVRATAGPTVPRLASLVGLVDDQQREILLLGPDRRDLVFRYRTRSTVWRLDQPDLRVPGALASLHPGDTVAITLWREQGGYCVLLNGTRICRVSFAAGRGWGILLYPESLAAWLKRLVDAGWLAGVLLPLGFCTPTRRALWAAGALLVSLGALPPLVGLLPTRVEEWMGGVAGVILGQAVRALVRTAHAAR